MKTKKDGLFYSTITILALFFFQPSFAKVETTLGLPINQNPNLLLKVPLTDAPEIILSREQYILSYNKFRRSPNWVAWKLESTQIGKSGRSNNFETDNDLENYLIQSSAPTRAVGPSDYKNSCFDRGHQIPSADRTDSLSNNEATFLMSNMIPQTSYLNRIIWEHLERHSRDLVQKQHKKLFIIAGPLYDKELGNIGPQKDIPIPSKNFKIIFILDELSLSESINSSTPVIAVIMPNVLQDGSQPTSNIQGPCKEIDTSITDINDWKKYQTTIQEIEKISGLTFSMPQISTSLSP